MHGDDLRDSRLSSPQTSSPHLIATPKSHRTTSPPTSHQDDVSANSAPSSATKGKGKHKAQQLVEPLRLEAHPASRSLENATRPRSGLGQREKKRKVKVTLPSFITYISLSALCSRRPRKNFEKLLKNVLG
jgi:mediator of replication checkpoint protein 1